MKIKEYRNKNMLVLLIILIGSLGLGFAFLRTNLTINGTGKIRGNTWNIYFDNINVTEGSVELSSGNTIPTIDPISKTEVTYAITLNSPGDFYEFTIDVVNGGTIDAALQSQTLTGAESYDFIKYTVTKADGSAVPSDLVLTGGDGSTPGQSVKLKVRVEYDKAAVSNSNVSLNISPLSLTYQMKFVQD